MTSSATNGMDYYQRDVLRLPYQIDPVALQQPPIHPFYLFSQLSLHQSHSAANLQFMAPIQQYPQELIAPQAIPAFGNFPAFVPSVINADLPAPVLNVNCSNVNFNPNAYTSAVNAVQTQALSMSRISSAPSLNAMQKDVGANRGRSTNAPTRLPNRNANNSAISNSNNSSTSNNMVQFDLGSETRQLPVWPHGATAHNVRPQCPVLPPRLAAKSGAERVRGPAQESCAAENSREESAPKYSILKRESSAKRDVIDTSQIGQTVTYEARVREYEAARRRILGCPVSGCNCNGTCDASVAGSRHQRKSNSNSLERDLQSDCTPSATPDKQPVPVAAEQASESAEHLQTPPLASVSDSDNQIIATPQLSDNNLAETEAEAETETDGRNDSGNSSAEGDNANRSPVRNEGKITILKRERR